MGWTTPKTWATSDPTTAALFNTHIKDNLAHLKTPFDDTGKLAALASSYLANLDGNAGMHGVKPLNGAPPWTDVTGGTIANGAFTKTAVNGWGNGWARSVTWVPVSTDCCLEWTIPGGGFSAAYVGLSFDFGGNEQLLDYAVYFGVTGGAGSIIENWSAKASPTLNAGDVVRIDVTSGTVRYYVNSTLAYTSLTPAGGSVLYACISSYYGTSVLSGVVWDMSGRHTAGRNDFTSGTLVVPVGTDKFSGFAGAKKPGSIWVEGDYLHHVSSGGVEYRFLGAYISTPAGAVAGSLWIETSGYTSIHYIDADGDERWVASSYSPHTDGAAVPGSLWAETYLHSTVASGVEYQAHVDTHTNGTTHSNTAHTDTHSNSHGNTAHTNSHSDTYANHTDVGHADSHGNFHGDVSHDDTHTDNHGNVTHADHSDHGDVPHDDRPENLGT